MNESGIYETLDVAVCPVPDKPAPLSTLSTLRFSNMFNTRRVSFPITILLPADTDEGICVTYISVVAAPAVIGVERLE